MTLAAVGPITRAQFEAIREQCDNWGRWGAGDERGTLNHVTPAAVLRALAGVREARTLSLAWPIDTVPGPDNVKPAEHRFTRSYDVDLGDGGALRLASDYLGIDCHGDAHSHIDALSHVAFDGRLYNGVPARPGVERLSIDALKDGIVTRGVLLDLPRLRGTSWIEPGEAVGPLELADAAERAGVTPERGDVLLVRTGHALKRETDGAWQTAATKAGLHPTALPLLQRWEIAAAGFDGDGEAVPSPCDEVALPIHAIAIASMGLTLLDCLYLEQLAAACATLERWEFAVVIAPLRIPRGTGSPVNPIAIL
jgi:kynurenine formamidase